MRDFEVVSTTYRIHLGHILGEAVRGSYRCTDFTHPVMDLVRNVRGVTKVEFVYDMMDSHLLVTILDRQDTVFTRECLKVTLAPYIVEGE